MEPENFGGKMKLRTFLLSALLVTLAIITGTAAFADIYNPKPAKGDLILPMPGGASIVFRPVFLGEGDAPFAMRKFNVGDPNGGFKEYPTTVVIGGAFLGEDQGRKDWLYYMGKYEVTEAQYYAMMGLPEGKPESLLQSQLPMSGISWLETMEFMDRYNQWLFGNALDKLPKNQSAVGYTRLPSEAEWEFAARGGSKVSADHFDRKKPYKGNLTKYEWFSGPKSSHNKIKKIGLLSPNILGIHDILGNVAEMSNSLYQIEYYQGRSGGFVARGGHFLTAEKKLRSSLRTEEPLYIGNTAKGFKPNRKSTLGFRLVLSSIIYADRSTAKNLAAAWEGYRSGKGATLPAAISISPISTKTNVKSQDAFLHLERLKKELGKAAGIPKSAKQELGLLEASLGDIRFILKQADEDSAYAWAKIAAERGFFIYRELQKLPTLKQLIGTAEKAGRAKMIKKLKQRESQLSTNIEQALSTYSDSFRQLGTIGPESVEKGFERYTKFLLERNAAEQLRVLKTVRQHSAAFNKEKRADQDKWKKDLTFRKK